MSDAYGRAVAEADSALASLVTAADTAYGAGNYSIIVTADHGGHEYSHGTDDVRDVTIPWIAWGRGVETGEIESAIDTTDTAATVLWLLGVAPPREWDGAPVVDAFVPLLAESAAAAAGATR